MSMTKYVPEIRFNDFVGNWQLLKLEDVAQFHDERRKPITESAREPGPYPYYGASGIIDYVKDYIFDEEMILLSEDGANIIDRNYRVSFLASGQYWVNNHAHVLKAKQGNNNLFLCESLERLRYDKYNTGTAQPKINQDVCRNLPVYITDNDEQEIIGNYFQKLDTLINQHQQKHSKLSNLKKAMLEKMFPKAGETVPEIRFEGFSGKWEERSWCDTVDISTKMVDPRDSQYGELFHVGPGNIESFTGRFYDNVLKVRESNLISGKFHFNEGDIIYGKINPQLAKYVIAPFEGLASADAYVLRAKNGVVQSYLFTIIQSEDFYKYSVSVSSRTGMPKINRDELNIFSYMAPKEQEQNQIGNYFQKLDALISQHSQQIIKLKNIKQACLDKMFV